MSIPVGVKGVLATCTALKEYKCGNSLKGMFRHVSTPHHTSTPHTRTHTHTHTRARTYSPHLTKSFCFASACCVDVPQRSNSETHRRQQRGGKQQEEREQ